VRYAPLAVERLGAAVFVLPADAAKPTRRERVSRRGPSGAGERAARALTQERAQRTLRCPQAGRTAAASRRPGERPPSSARPRRLSGHGKPSTAARSAAHSPAVKDQSNTTPLRPGRGLGAPSHQRVRTTRPDAPARACRPCTRSACDRRPPTGRTAHPHGGTVTAQRTTRMLASPCVSTSRAGGSLPGVSATCALPPPARTQAPVGSGNPQVYGGAPPRGSTVPSAVELEPVYMLMMDRAGHPTREGVPIEVGCDTGGYWQSIPHYSEK